MKNEMLYLLNVGMIVFLSILPLSRQGDLYTGALFIQQSLNWDLYVSIVILIVLTASLTITGESEREDKG